MYQSQLKWISDFIWNIADDRLIADVVTGQIDVRGWVSGLDDVVSNSDLAALVDGSDNDESPEDENITS